ncbi:MAG: pilin [Patescibacteria group bacterium]|nr:pilin [Patescibacteria group bacterium]
MKKTRYFILLFLISLVAVTMMPGTLSADTIEIKNPLASDEFEDIINNVINFIFKIATVLAPLMVIMAGFLFVTAGGNLEQIKRAKNIIIWTAVGFFVILLARGIMGMIMNLLGVS